MTEDRLGIISIPAKTVASLLGIGADVRTELISVAAWDPDLRWGNDLDDVKKSVPIGDCRVISHEFNFESQSYRLLVHHRSLPPVSPGALIPALEVECRTSNRESLTVERF